MEEFEGLASEGNDRIAPAKLPDVRFKRIALKS